MSSSFPSILDDFLLQKIKLDLSDTELIKKLLNEEAVARNNTPPPSRRKYPIR